jgi:iron-sulfur cluster assembly protein
MSEVETKITKDITIDEIFTRFPHKAPRLAQELQNAGLQCVGCHASTWETLEAGVLGHGKSEEFLEKLINRLNDILAEEQDLSTISITPAAAQKYLDILEEEGKAGYGVRLTERAAGCSGFEYALDFSQSPKSDDEVFESNGVQIHVKKAMVERMMGSEIDFVDGLYGSGFKVSNPNVKSSCGCGSSHNY